MLQSPAKSLNAANLIKEVFANIAPADLDAHLKKIKEETEQHTDNPENWNTLGSTLANKGSAFMEKAIRCFSTAVSMNPQNPDFVVNLLLAQARNANNLRTAFDFFIAATRFDVSDKAKACIWLNIAHALEKTNERAHLTLHCCLYANMLDKTNIKAWQTLANYYDKGYGCNKNKNRAKTCAENATRVQNKQELLPFDKVSYTENGMLHTYSNGKVPKPEIEHLCTPVPTVAKLPDPAVAKPQALLPSFANLLMPPPSIQGKPAAKRAQPEPRSEVDLLKEEVKLKQQRIDMMEAEMKIKDAQLENLRQQLAQYEPKPTGRRSPRN